MADVVVIEGVEIPERLIAEEVQHHRSASGAEARLAAAHALATKALLLNRAAELGLNPTPNFDESGREETREEAQMRALLEAEIETVAPSEAECRRVYAARFAPRPDAPAFEAVRAMIAESLERRAWTSSAARYVARLAGEARARGVAISLAGDGRVTEGPATLGRLMADGAADRLGPWLAASDPRLAARVTDVASAEGLTAAAFVRSIFDAFVRAADDEAWTQVVSAARDAEDPALGCLAAVLRARLEPKPAFHTVVRRR